MTAGVLFQLKCFSSTEQCKQINKKKISIDKLSSSTKVINQCRIERRILEGQYAAFWAFVNFVMLPSSSYSPLQRRYNQYMSISVNDYCIVSTSDFIPHNMNVMRTTPVWHKCLVLICRNPQATASHFSHCLHKLNEKRLFSRSSILLVDAKLHICSFKAIYWKM